MKKNCLFLVTLLISLASFSQIRFLPGYFVSNDGKRTICQIKDVDWKNNPTSFVYRLDANGKETTATITDVSEFGIDNGKHYLRAKVDIDRSSSDMNHLSRNRNPEYSNEVLFLKYLVEGKASLFYYEESTLVRMFYSKDGGNPIQLIYKKYEPADDKTETNSTYLQQLINDVKCGAITNSEIEALPYNNRALTKHFIKYNKCVTPGFSNEAVNSKGNFNITLQLGLNSTHLDVKNSLSPDETQAFKTKAGIRAGVELEYIFSFGKNRWAAFSGVQFRSYKDEAYRQTILQKDTAAIDYKSVEIPIGIRHYLFLSKSAKLFFSGGISLDLPGESTYQPFFASKVKINSVVNPLLGVGVKFGERANLELRYGFKRQLMHDQRAWDTNYTTVSLVAGFTIL